ncbi:MAG: hypothetical protein HOV67_23130 [Kribbellaceae bacterium]|nr:hypothetical protein [Kribbellaceae bacterium]
MAKRDETPQDVLDVLRGVADGVKAGTVFGAPVSHNGLTVLPVARISGGGGGGRGDEAAAQGSGGGLGLSARPVGVYVIGNDKVTWSPAVDVTRVILGGQLVGIVALLTLRTLFKVIRDRRQAVQAVQAVRAGEDVVPDQVEDPPQVRSAARRRLRRSRLVRSGSAG